MKTRLVLQVLASSLLIASAAALAHGDDGLAAQHKTFDPAKVEATAFGQEGDPKKVTRTIRLSMTDAMRFTPADVSGHAEANTPTPEGSSPTAAAPMTEGEVRKVDREAGKLTLRHGPIANLDMPAMTMVFKATDPEMLENLKEGNKVRFTAERVNGAISVTRIEMVN